MAMSKAHPGKYERPNILLIQADQHRYDCVGRARRHAVQTPNLDRLAEDGVWFSHAYTPTPTCCPARQALLTARRAESFGALWNFDAFLPTGALDPGEYSWPRALRDVGYRTGYCGKWHVHPRYGPTHYGFDDVASNEDYYDYVARVYPDISYSNGLFGEKNPIPLRDARTHYMADRAIKLIRRYVAEGSPWHIRLDFVDPHFPCRPSEPFASMYRPVDIPPWASFSDSLEGKPYIQRQHLLNWGVQDYTWEDWAAIVAFYFGAISQLDHAVGKVLGELDELGVGDDTIVIYTSDHGDLCGSHRMFDKHYVMYDDVVRVPLIIRWRSHIRGGQERGEFVYNALDLPLTVLEAASLEKPEIFHGVSLMPLLRGEVPDHWREEVLCTYNGQSFGLYNQRMLRTYDWKYVWNPTDIDELYDLRNDPSELQNEIYNPNCAQVLANLRARLLELLIEYDDGIVKDEAWLPEGLWLRGQLQSGEKI